MHQVNRILAVLLLAKLQDVFYLFISKYTGFYISIETDNSPSSLLLNRFQWILITFLLTNMRTKIFLLIALKYFKKL